MCSWLPVFIQDLFVVDAIGWIFASVFGFIGILAFIYSFSYMKKYTHLGEYYLAFVLLILSLIGLSFSRNLILIYIFWELVAFSTWRLVGFHREPEAVKIADKTFLIMFFGSCMMLLGFILLYFNFDTFDILEMRGLFIAGLAKPSVMTMVLIFLGIIAKSATIPLHTWLADAHPVAPSPMSAVLSGLVAKVGILGFVRIFVQTFGLTNNWILILAGISSITAAGAAMLENDMKRIIAYSTVSQLGYIFLGLGLMTNLGIISGLLYFMAHAIAKAGLFLCAGIVERSTGERDIRKLGGLIKSMPVTGVSFLFCTLSIMGIPPFFGFYPKLGTIMGLVEKGHFYIAILSIIIAIMTILYLMRIFNAVFLGTNEVSRASSPTTSSGRVYSANKVSRASSTTTSSGRVYSANKVSRASSPTTGSGRVYSANIEGTKLMLAVVIILATLSLQLGLFINIPLDFVQGAVNIIR
ncbi:hypothetical protein AUJ66_05080 [Candidatus Desantisbacteria bacterium CG1_02_38_46]|uniref:NADH:quinone oxidoreductase/Mrp antiporter transmembrane domain-containing protein n=2 Tax=unclassified Candidatus Desantisiibacteriota TaxID=3106372 RepID=A0A1J4SC64_9BACT|nr:MAG: hypothetical protein AUJ66_05080 [Candidatus Desantisbacteria bacterium CG1_02_38_46]PIU50753.1 MAG: peroxiredoxin family protein [Candidatus Desantisbacteria bacterium CG07_land_8_20_14_0_80_39_15]